MNAERSLQTAKVGGDPDGPCLPACLPAWIRTHTDDDHTSRPRAKPCSSTELVVLEGARSRLGQRKSGRVLSRTFLHLSSILSFPPQNSSRHSLKGNRKNDTIPFRQKAESLRITRTILASPAAGSKSWEARSSYGRTHQGLCSNPPVPHTAKRANSKRHTVCPQVCTPSGTSLRHRSVLCTQLSRIQAESFRAKRESGSGPCVRLCLLWGYSRSRSPPAS
mmetsp:Transcript_13423/g.26546  ORF Transcript_13423/g.26546 Transcript_13423/m.26546 type:complete len:221 (+) Transcript_13423:335-997(+)